MVTHGLIVGLMVLEYGRDHYLNDAWKIASNLKAFKVLYDNNCISLRVIITDTLLFDIDFDVKNYLEKGSDPYIKLAVSYDNGNSFTILHLDVI